MEAVMTYGRQFQLALRLEMVKQRKTILGILAIYGLALLGAIVFTVLNPRGVHYFQTVVLFLFSIHVGVFSLVLSGNAASGIRSSSGKEVEESFPIHPVLRVAAAWVANAIFFVTSTVLLFALCRLSIGELTYDPYLAPIGLAIKWNWILWIAFQLNTTCFFLSYWVGISLIGGGLAAILTGLNLISLSAGIRQAQWFFRSHVVTCLPQDFRLMQLPEWIILVGAGFILVAVALSLIMLAPIFERNARKSVLGFYCLAVLWILPVIFSPLLSAWSAVPEIKKRMSEIHLLGDPYGIGAFPWRSNAIAGASSSPGALFADWNGNLMRIFENGERQMLFERRSVSRMKVFLLILLNSDRTEQELLEPHVSSIFLQPNGQIWAAVKAHSEKKLFQLLSTGRTGPLQVIAEFTRGPFEPLLIPDSSGKVVLLNGSLTTAEEGWKGQLEAIGGSEASNTYERQQIYKGRLAKLDINRTTLFWNNRITRAAMSWRLPGKARLFEKHDLEAPVAYESDGVKYFALSVSMVSERKQAALVFCGTDGSLQIHSIQPGSYWSHGTIPGGGNVFMNSEYMVVSPEEGPAYREINIQELYTTRFGEERYPMLHVRFVRVQGSHLWIVVKDQMLIEIDLKSGLVLKETDLHAPVVPPKGHLAFYRTYTPEGLYYADCECLYLMDWNGNLKKVTELVW